MSLRSPLARARGHGAAKDGVEHWWRQRVTSVALVPLVLWLAFSIAGLAGASYEEARAWLASPVSAVLAILTLAVVFYHLKLGLDVVIEDYVYGKGAKAAALMIAGFVCTLLGAATIFAVLKVSLGG